MVWQHSIAVRPSISTPMALPMMISQPGASSSRQLSHIRLRSRQG